VWTSRTTSEEAFLATKPQISSDRLLRIPIRPDVWPQLDKLRGTVHEAFLYQTKILLLLRHQLIGTLTQNINFQDTKPELEMLVISGHKFIHLWDTLSEQYNASNNKCRPREVHVWASHWPSHLSACYLKLLSWSLLNISGTWWQCEDFLVAQFTRKKSTSTQHEILVLGKTGS
jgi:hypothetical protein